MKAIRNRTTVITGAKTAMLGLALIGLASCSSGESSSGTVTTGGSAALQGPMVFVNNTGDKTLTSVALKGDSGNAVLNTLGPGVFGNVALGDMQFSEGEWLFMNLGATNQVATIDPLTGATPIFEANLPTGERPVHIYRDPTDGEVIWSMNDSNATTGLDTVKCGPPGNPTGPGVGGSVTVLHNSHLGPGGNPPHVIGTTCLLAVGHKVAAFSQPTATNPAIPKRTFISSSTAGEVSVLDNVESSPDYRKLIGRVDLCTDAGEAAQVPPQPACDDESATPVTTAFTPNKANPHGIRFSTLTGKIYSIQESYRTIVEIDPATLAITNTFNLSATPYTAYSITPNGRFLLLRGDTTPATGTKLGVIDLGTAGNPQTDFTIPELNGTSPGSFKFSPDGKRFYILAGNAAAATKKDRLFAFDSSTLTAPVPSLTLLKEIILVATGGHSMDVLTQGTAGAGEAKYIVVSNSTDNSVSIINATDNRIKQTVTVGPTPVGVMVYYPGAAAAGNQATSSLTGGSRAKPSVLPERLDDHGMPE
jgi:YVTN family beta-propeller protein